MMLDELREVIRTTYTTRFGFDPQRGSGLISDVFPDTFTPSVGHPEAIYTLHGDSLPSLRALIQDQCFRGIDLNRVGSGFHLSLFEMSVSLLLHDFDEANRNAEMKRAGTLLVEVFGFDPRHLYITTFPGGEIFGCRVEPDVWSSPFWQAVGIPPENVITAPGESCLLVPGHAGEPAGVRSEVYYWPTRDRPALEVATIEFLQFRYANRMGRQVLEELPNGAGLFATAYGIERIAMAKHGFASVFEIPELRELVTALAPSSWSPSFHDLNPQPGRIIVDACRAAAAIMAAGQCIDGSRRGRLLRNVLNRLIRAAEDWGISATDAVSSIAALHSSALDAHGAALLLAELRS